MLILACDTSGPQASVALWSDGRLAAEIVIQRSQPHAVTLMPAVEDLLDRCAILVRPKSTVSPVLGPGSFYRHPDRHQLNQPWPTEPGARPSGFPR